MFGMLIEYPLLFSARAVLRFRIVLCSALCSAFAAMPPAKRSARAASVASEPGVAGAAASMPVPKPPQNARTNSAASMPLTKPAPPKSKHAKSAASAPLPQPPKSTPAKAAASKPVPKHPKSTHAKSAASKPVPQPEPGKRIRRARSEASVPVPQVPASVPVPQVPQPVSSSTVEEIAPAQERVASKPVNMTKTADKTPFKTFQFHASSKGFSDLVSVQMAKMRERPPQRCPIQWDTFVFTDDGFRCQWNQPRVVRAVYMFMLRVVRGLPGASDHGSWWVTGVSDPAAAPAVAATPPGFGPRCAPCLCLRICLPGFGPG